MRFACATCWTLPAKLLRSRKSGARISPDAQARHSNIPWAEIVGMRNHLVHGYFDIDLDRLWATVMHDLPQLASSLERILSRPTR
jgi:uncharacterized protein with HEPN domain